MNRNAGMTRGVRREESRVDLAIQQRVDGNFPFDRDHLCVAVPFDAVSPQQQKHDLVRAAAVAADGESFTLEFRQARKLGTSIAFPHYLPTTGLDANRSRS